VPRLGLKAPFRAGTARDLALRVLALARAGLKSRAHNDRIGQDETAYLNDIQLAAEKSMTFAEELLDAFHTRWKGNIDPIFIERAF
jgi:glutamate--cysteine ligase